MIHGEAIRVQGRDNGMASLNEACHKYFVMVKGSWVYFTLTNAFSEENVTIS